MKLKTLLLEELYSDSTPNRSKIDLKKAQKLLLNCLPVAEAAVVPAAPGPELSRAVDGDGVVVPRGHLDHLLTRQRRDRPRRGLGLVGELDRGVGLVVLAVGAVAQLAVLRQDEFG